MNRLRSERGGIFAISALIIPVFILLTALVLDTGHLVHAQALAPEPR